jgi:hypothetical protein
MKVEQHFVTFYSPGTFVAEDTIKHIPSWDVETAKRMVHSIKERHGATPYAFQFSTRGRNDTDLDSKVIATSPLYYLGGKIETLEEVKTRATDKDRILISNMEGNGYKRIITTDNSWSWTQLLNPTDIVLDWP